MIKFTASCFILLMASCNANDSSNINEMSISAPYVSNDSVNLYNFFKPLPENDPIIFGNGTVSTADCNEHTLTIVGNIILFTRDPDNRIYFIEYTDSVLHQPRLASFKGRETILSADSRRLYFSKEGDIYFFTLENQTFQGPSKLESPVNTNEYYEYYASSSLDGQIYFSRIKNNQANIFVYGEGKVEPLPYPVNSGQNDFHPFIASDGSYLLFNSKRTGGKGEADIYIVFKSVDGEWGDPKNLGEKINTKNIELCPVVTNDGKYLFFTRLAKNSNGIYEGNIYWVKADFLWTLK